MQYGVAPSDRQGCLMRRARAPQSRLRLKRKNKPSIIFACIGNTSPLTALPFNSYIVIFFHECHLGSLPPPPINLTRQWKP